MASLARLNAERSAADAIQARLAMKYSVAIRKALATQIEAAARALEAGGNAGDAANAIMAKSKPLTDALTATWSGSAKVFAKRQLDGMKRHHPGMELKADMGDAAASYMQRFAGERIVQVQRTTIEQVRQIVMAGFSEGAGNAEIARAMRKAIPDLTKLRSQVIARTETHTAANVGSFVAADSMGLKLKKVWSAVSDDRTRDAHRDVNGQEVDMAAPFIVESEELKFPGDPAGSPENIINCRCAVLYEEG